MERREPSDAVKELIRRRKEAGISQTQLAQEAKVQQVTISRWETGTHPPNHHVFEAVMRTLDKLERRARKAAKTG